MSSPSHPQHLLFGSFAPAAVASSQPLQRAEHGPASGPQHSLPLCLQRSSPTFHSGLRCVFLHVSVHKPLVLQLCFLKFICSNPAPNVTACGDRAFGEEIKAKWGLKDGPLIWQDWCPVRRQKDTSNFLISFSTCPPPPPSP